MKHAFIYIITNKNHSVLYTGVTCNLIKRIFEHKNHLVKGFTNKYNVEKLVYYQEYSSIIDAIKREKQIKKWKREWKLQLISQTNPEWKELYDDIC